MESAALRSHASPVGSPRSLCDTELEVERELVDTMIVKSTDSTHARAASCGPSYRPLPPLLSRPRAEVPLSNMNFKRRPFTSVDTFSGLPAGSPRDGASMLPRRHRPAALRVNTGLGIGFQSAMNRQRKRSQYMGLGTVPQPSFNRLGFRGPLRPPPILKRVPSKRNMRG